MNYHAPRQTYDQSLAELEADCNDVARYLQEMAQAADHEFDVLMAPLSEACKAGICSCRTSHSPAPSAAEELDEAARFLALQRAMHSAAAVLRAVPRQGSRAGWEHQKQMNLGLDIVELKRRASFVEMASARPQVAA